MPRPWRKRVHGSMSTLTQQETQHPMALPGSNGPSWIFAKMLTIVEGARIPP
jgi:hypothetical protein